MLKPPHPPWVCSFFFNQLNAYFWKEMYWAKGGPIAVAQASMQDVAQKRLAITNSDVTLQAITFSDATLFRDIYFSVPPGNGQGTFGAVADRNEAATIAALFRFQTANGKAVTRPIRGIPSAVIVNPNTILTTNAAYNSAVVAFINSVISNTNIVFKSLPNPPGFTIDVWSTGGEFFNVHNRKTGSRPFSPFRGRRA